MFSIINLMSAKRRLKESNITIEAMGGYDESPPMLLAQNEMIKLEVDYYQEKSNIFTRRLLYFILICVILFTSYTLGLFNL